MTNNDVLRRVRYIKNFSDQEMIEVFNLAKCSVSRGEVSSWLKKDDHPDYQDIKDVLLATFLTGLITKYRGQKEVLKLADFRLSKGELSAFFRNPDHKNYRECKSQVLRNFLQGLQIKFRGETDA